MQRPSPARSSRLGQAPRPEPQAPPCLQPVGRRRRPSPLLPWSGAESETALHLPARRSAASSSVEQPLLQGASLLQLGRERKEALAAVLVCTEKGLVRIARRYPALLTMDPEDVFYRLLALKDRLPRCNLAAMVHGQPILFLSRPSAEVLEQVASTYQLYAEELPQMDVDSVVQERPAILFIEREHLERGLPEIRSMTGAHPADSTTCANLLWAIFGRGLEDRYNQVF